MDDLIKLCDKMEACRKSRKCKSNAVICAKRFVYDYMKGDRNRLLKLQAELKIHRTELQINSDIALLIPVASFILTIIGTTTIEEQDISIYIQCATLFMFIIMAVYVIGFIGMNKNKHRNKWKKYIEVVIEDIVTEKNSNH